MVRVGGQSAQRDTRRTASATCVPFCTRPWARLNGDTRHTCASLLAALDVHPRVAMRTLGHSQISVTMNVYTQIPSPETRKALDRLNASLNTGQPSS
ncbi:hypothetical protein DMB42_37405 [Nonomuraea sp. WAC 01424]|nr:hypothetical protein DMB42_37405 [Nonomuraea sp. WAC 01424]